MSFMSALTAFAGQAGGSQTEQLSPEQHAGVTQALMQHFSSQPSGLNGLVDQFRQNGMGQHVDNWMTSQPGSQPTQQIAPQQVEQGIGSGALQSIAQRAGVSPELTKIALATALPLLMSHLSQGSGQLPEQASGGGLASLAEGLFTRAL